MPITKSFSLSIKNNNNVIDVFFVTNDDKFYFHGEFVGEHPGLGKMLNTLNNKAMAYENDT